jgi:hypothetical protein
MFLFALPAGALADTVDKRRFLIGSEIVLTVFAAISSGTGLVRIDQPAHPIVVHVRPWCGRGLHRARLAVRRTSVGTEARPNRGGDEQRRRSEYQQSDRASAGWRHYRRIRHSAPFWINALSNFAVIGALLWWRPQPSQGSGLPPEHLTGALVVGLRHARYNPYLRASLIRAVAFFFFASAYWALLPLVSRNQIDSGPELYGIRGAHRAGRLDNAVSVTPAIPSIRASRSARRISSRRFSIRRNCNSSVLTLT